MAMVPAKRERGMSASARSTSVNRRVPALPDSGTVMVRSSRSGRWAACASIDWRATSARRVRSPTCMEADWSTTSRPMSRSDWRVSCTSRGPVSHSSSTAKAARRNSVPRPRRQRPSATTASDRTPRRDQQPDRQQRIEADRGDDLFGAHQIGNAILLPSWFGVSGLSVILSSSWPGVSGPTTPAQVPRQVARTAGP